jgi:hypothetical protein
VEALKNRIEKKEKKRGIKGVKSLLLTNTNMQTDGG